MSRDSDGNLKIGRFFEWKDRDMLDAVERQLTCTRCGYPLNYRMPMRCRCGLNQLQGVYFIRKKYSPSRQLVRASKRHVKALEARELRWNALARWEQIRKAVNTRKLIVFWMEESAKNACAPDGVGRRADLLEFETEFGL